jgi:hypothetical protein
MDVNPLKPVPVVQPPRKVEREREDRERGKERAPAKKIEQDDQDDAGKRIDTYA